MPQPTPPATFILIPGHLSSHFVGGETHGTGMPTSKCLAGEGVTMLEYHAAYYQIEDGWYMATVLDFPGVITQGRTLKSARTMVKDALQLRAEVTLEEGQPLPRPNPKAKDKKALIVKPIHLQVRVRTAAAP